MGYREVTVRWGDASRAAPRLRTAAALWVFGPTPLPRLNNACYCGPMAGDRHALEGPGADEIRHRLVAAAAEVFAESGYDGARVAEIAARSVAFVAVSRPAGVSLVHAESETRLQRDAALSSHGETS